MKRNVARILSGVCMMALLLTCLGASAFAIETQQYKVKAGETVLSICNKLGIDFYKNQDWIKTTNHITSWNKIAVGTVLTLPASGTVAGSPSAVTSGAPVQTATVTGVTAAGLLEGDRIVSYLVNHVMRAGETVGAVCASYGTNFSANSETIKQLSGITSWNRIPVGKVVVIPTTQPPKNGESFTAIVAHTVKAGETVATICSTYGLNYGKVFNQLKTLNNTDNLNVIRAGQIFYLPIPSAALGTISVIGTGSGTGTGAAGGSGTIPTGGTTTTLTPTTGAVSPTGTTNSPHGSFRLQVNGKDVTTAAAGQVVTIVASPEPGYEVNTVTIMKVGGGEYVIPDGMTFMMPSFPITVQVTFRAIA